MYESYFGFSEPPFQNNLDHRFLFISDDHQEVFAALSCFTETRKGLALICGDAGTGKTMLINSFLSTLPEDVQPIIVTNPFVTFLELLRYLAKSLKIEFKENAGIPELTDALRGFLKQRRSLHKQVVLIIDEAHLLSTQTLEEIRLLSTSETHDQNLFQILFVGQYELNYKLDQPEMRHLGQSIDINRFLSPLDSSETRQYLEHRLRQVGSSFSAIFEYNCGSAIYKMTGGVPRNINQLCDNALLICMSEMRQKIDRKILRKAQETLLTDRLFVPNSAKRSSNRRLKLPRPMVWIAMCATFLVLSFILMQNSFSKKISQTSSQAASHLTDRVPGVKAASALNPKIKNREVILPGQVVSLPRINSNGQIMQLQSNLFYAYYGHCKSANTMRRFTSLLDQKGVKYTAVATRVHKGTPSYRIFLGGYETVADLQKAFDLIKTK